MNLVESVTSIAKCGSTLELHTPAGGFSAIPFLEKSLRMYTRVSGKDMGADVDMDSGTMHVEPTEKKRVIEEYFADIPVSRGQCESGWFELCAFVSRDLRDGATCWQPSPRVKLDVWKKIVDGAVLHGIDLEKQFLANDLWKAVIEDGEEPFPQLLFEAVLRRVCESGDGQHFSALADIKCEYWIINVDYHG